jgi:hypothetical protein
MLASSRSRSSSASPPSRRAGRTRSQQRRRRLGKPPLRPEPGDRRSGASGLHSRKDAATARHRRKPGCIDKSVLPIGERRRYRDRAHLEFVASQPCLICGRQPSDPHHLRFAQIRALGRKASDEFTVPLCRTHHREAHLSRNERAWWRRLGLDALKIAEMLWKKTRLANARAATGTAVPVTTADVEGGQVPSAAVNTPAADEASATEPVGS